LSVLSCTERSPRGPDATDAERGARCASPRPGIRRR